MFTCNRLPHSIFQHKCTPYEILTGLKPDFTKLRVFDSRIVVCKLGNRNPKIAKHSYSGIFYYMLKL